jgi:hypothetical protein
VHKEFKFAGNYNLSILYIVTEIKVF